MEKHGIHYFFQQTDTNHKMIIVDGPPYSAAEESPVAFHRSKDSRGTVRRWTHSYEPQIRKWTNRDRDYRINPPVTQQSEETVIPEVRKSTQGDHFEFPGGFAVLTSPGDESDYAHNLARIRVQEEETRFDVFSGNSVRATFAAGTRIKVIGVAEQKQEERITVEEEKDYLITSVTFSATEVGYTDDKAGEIVAKLISDAAIAGALRGLDRFDDAQKNNMPDVNKVINSLPVMPNVMAAFGVGFIGPWLALLLDWASPVLSDIPVLSILVPKVPKPPPYSNSFCCVPIVSGRQYRSPSVSSKPRVPGPQTAMVHGPTDEDVWTDELGRILVKFDWDRTSKGDEHGETTSCWLRVVQGWAGPRWGMQFLPRVGEEVLVDFIDGDPDRPIVTGRVYQCGAQAAVRAQEISPAKRHQDTLGTAWARRTRTSSICCGSTIRPAASRCWSVRSAAWTSAPSARPMRPPAATATRSSAGRIPTATSRAVTSISRSATTIRCMSTAVATSGSRSLAI